MQLASSYGSRGDPRKSPWRIVRGSHERRRPSGAIMVKDTRDTSGWLTRQRALVGVLVLATLGVGWLALRLTAPFVPALTWALTLAVVGRPIQRWLCRHIRPPGLAAAVATAFVTLIVALPALVVAGVIAGEAIDTSDTVRAFVEEQRWQRIGEAYPALAPAVDWVASHARTLFTQQGLVDDMVNLVQGVTTVSIYTAAGALITVFFLFYFFRDRAELLDAVTHLSPLSPRETSDVLDKIRETIRTMVYGTLLVAALQGFLAGLAFWWLDLPAPVMWGAVMAILSILPIFGSALVWVPAAIYLALSGEVSQALLLTAWGALLVGMVDNVVKPMIVRGTMHLHTIPVFIAIVGGIAVFGATGLVLGPLVLAVLVGLLDVWRRRLADPSVAPAAPAPGPNDEGARADRRRWPRTASRK